MQEVNSNQASDEIDLVELLRFFWGRKWIMIKSIGLFTVFGLVVAFTTPEEYQTSSTLIPENSGADGKLSGSLGGLASLTGIDLGGLSGASQTINPALYHRVSRSTPFLIDLMNEEFFFESIGAQINLQRYYSDHYESSLFGKILNVPGRLIQWLRGSGDESAVNYDESILKLSKEEHDIIEDLKGRVFVELDWELNLVTVEVEMRDPRVAADMVQFAQDYITKYVTDYAVSKGMQQLASVEEQYKERKKEFEIAQSRLAYFQDRNQNVSTARANSETERLQSEYNLAFNIYNQLAQQREAIRLQVEENTPVFTVLEPVKIPITKSKPRRFLILFLYAFIGTFFGGIYILTRPKVKR